MGKKLLKYYDVAKEQGGLVALMRLSIKSGIPKTKAIEMEDTPEVEERIRSILAEVLGVRVTKS